ncbi:hypothetical protein C8N26_1891 [Tenacibaculum lutimaris]|uniref:Uncharacterized protein n=1 Tax=Tenacibaculum lutimaris TaxID=285258 RepID=A0A420E0S0_9FLAO|nr:hypothetical protein C8N26_1891 [Tenacibaculum lutimaris]
MKSYAKFVIEKVKNLKSIHYDDYNFRVRQAENNNFSK